MSNEITLIPKFNSDNDQFDEFVEEFEINFKSKKESFIGSFNSWNIEIILNKSNVLLPANIKLDLLINNIKYAFPSFSLVPVVDSETGEYSKVKGYDKSIIFDDDFDLKIDYPITMGDFAQKICDKKGIELANKNFINNNFIITRQKVDNKKTYREVIGMIAAIAVGNAFINSNDQLEIRSFLNTNKEVNEYFSAEKFVKIGPITGVNLAREPIKDYTILNDKELTEQNEKCIVKITNNLIVDDNREKAIENIYQNLKGLEFYCKKVITFEAIGIEPFSFVYLNNNKVLVDTISIKYPSLIDSYISSNQPTKEDSNLDIARGIEKRIKNAEAQVDAINAVITLQSEEIDENTSKIAKLTLSSETFELNLKKKLDKTSLITEFNASAEKIEMKSNRISIASNYFTLSAEGKITAKEGSIAGINFNNQGLFYSGKSANDGFGLWKNGVHSSEGSYIIFHAGANNGNIGSANFRVYQNGTVYASLLKIVSNKTTATGIEITGTEPFVDFKAKNSSSYTTRIIDYGNQLIIASDSDLTIANRGNSAWRSLRCSRVYLENDNNFVWSSDNSIYISTGGNVNFTNQNNNGYISLFAGRYHIDGDSVLVWQTNGQMLLSSSTGVSVVTTNNSAYLPILASAFTKNSSRRYKENIVDMTEERANKILDLETKVFDYNEESKMNAKNVSGLIAEEVENIIPEAVVYRKIDGIKVPDSIDYTSFIPYLIKEVQILNKKLKKLEGRQ